GRAGGAAGFDRALHTLKGNAALFGLGSVADMCHGIESRMAEEQAPPDAASIAALEELWLRLVTPIDHLLAERRRAVDLSIDQHAALEHAVRAGAAPAQLLRMLRELTLEPVEPRLRHFAEQASRIGKRLDKQVAVRVSHDGLRLDGQRWS